MNDEQIADIVKKAEAEHAEVQTWPQEQQDKYYKALDEELKRSAKAIVRDMKNYKCIIEHPDYRDAQPPKGDPVL